MPKRYRPIGYLEHLVRTKTKGRVFDGPFKGMTYIEDAVGSAYIPKMLGIYERELNECIEHACALDLPLVVDIGAAEGYYAVGLARRMVRTQVVAFEMEQKGRELLHKMALLNNVTERISMNGKCEVEDLSETLKDEPRSLIICDVEGYEDILIDPKRIPSLGTAHILVELHDFIVPGVTERIQERFAPSHDIRVIDQEERRRSDLPWRTLGTAMLPGSYLDWAVSEWRPVRMSWLWMQPKQR